MSEQDPPPEYSREAREMELLKSNLGLQKPPDVEPGTKFVTCDACQCLITLWHFRTVDTHVDLCNACVVRARGAGTVTVQVERGKTALIDLGADPPYFMGHVPPIPSECLEDEVDGMTDKEEEFPDPSGPKRMRRTVRRSNKRKRGPSTSCGNKKAWPGPKSAVANRKGANRATEYHRSKMAAGEEQKKGAHSVSPNAEALPTEEDNARSHFMKRPSPPLPPQLAAAEENQEANRKELKKTTKATAARAKGLALEETSKSTAEAPSPAEAPKAEGEEAVFAKVAERMQNLHTQKATLLPRRRSQLPKSPLPSKRQKQLPKLPAPPRRQKRNLKKQYSQKPLLQKKQLQYAPKASLLRRQQSQPPRFPLPSKHQKRRLKKQYSQKPLPVKQNLHTQKATLLPRR